MPAEVARPWQILVGMVYNWWPVIFIPLGIALLAALGALQERKSGNYRCLRAYNISPVAIWAGKVIVMAINTLIATIFLMVALVISGFISAGGTVPWLEIFAGGMTMWLASLALIPVQLWAASWKGTFFGLAAGFAGMIAGVWAAAKSGWVYSMELAHKTYVSDHRGTPERGLPGSSRFPEECFGNTAGDHAVHGFPDHIHNHYRSLV